jgi:cell division protein FtsB
MGPTLINSNHFKISCLPISCLISLLWIRFAYRCKLVGADAVMEKPPRLDRTLKPPSRGAMDITHQPPHPLTRGREVAVHYGQSDVDTIRQQIEQTEAMKRRWLFMAMIVSIAALVGAIVLLSTNYALYSSAESEKKKLVQENAALKTRVDQTQQQLDAKNAQDTKQAESRADAQKRLQSLLPSIMKGSAGPNEIAAFARMVHAQPGGRIELDSAPPDKIFRNWKTTNGNTSELYTLVGGFVGGKWVVYSNLVAGK